MSTHKSLMEQFMEINDLYHLIPFIFIPILILSSYPNLFIIDHIYFTFSISFSIRTLMRPIPNKPIPIRDIKMIGMGYLDEILAISDIMNLFVLV